MKDPDHRKKADVCLMKILMGSQSQRIEENCGAVKNNLRSTRIARGAI